MNIKQFIKTAKPNMRLKHYGEKMFVDYSGLTIPWIDKDTGVIHYAEIFVAALGASNYTYVEACAAQSIVEWIKAHCHALEFFNGVPRCIIPDNLKSGELVNLMRVEEIDSNLILSGEIWSLFATVFFNHQKNARFVYFINKTARRGKFNFIYCI